MIVSFRFLQLLGIVPTDPGILQKLGEIFESDNDKQQAYHYHFEVIIFKKPFVTTHVVNNPFLIPLSICKPKDNCLPLSSVISPLPIQF